MARRRGHDGQTHADHAAADPAASPAPPAEAPAAAAETAPAAEAPATPPPADTPVIVDAIAAPAPSITPLPRARDYARRRWAVQLVGHPRRIVEADDEAGAWEAYRVPLGIIASDHPHAVEPADAHDAGDDAEA